MRSVIGVQLASCLEGIPLMWMMPLHLHLPVNQKSDYDDDDVATSEASSMMRALSGAHCTNGRLYTLQIKKGTRTTSACEPLHC